MNNYSSRTSENLSRLLTLGLAQSVVAFLVFVCAPNTWGNGGEFENVDTLPQTENIVFSKRNVGIISKDGRYFVLERKTDRLKQVDAQSFAHQFTGPWPPKPYEKLQSKEILRSSSGQEFEQQPAYCGEGAKETHELRYQQRPFADVLNPCMSVAALEIVGSHIWFGTIRPGEGGAGPGEGLVVQPLMKKLKVTSITTQSGLTGDQIWVVRDDPFTKTVWVGTEWGLNQIDRHFQVVWGRYWHEDFETSSRTSQIFLTTSRKTNNQYAVLGRELAVQDWTAFSRAIEQISPVVQNKFRLYEFHMSGFPPRGLSVEMNGLVPFFIEAAQSEALTVHDFGLRNLCKFDDPRVHTFMAALASKTVAQSTDERHVQECLKAWPTRVP